MSLLRCYRNGDILMLDLQLVRRGNPCVDLSYFLGSSTSPEFRKDNLDRLLKQYHKSLVGYLVDLGYGEDVYKLEDFMKDFRGAFLFGVILGVVHSSVRIRVRNVQLTVTY